MILKSLLRTSGGWASLVSTVGEICFLSRWWLSVRTLPCTCTVYRVRTHIWMDRYVSLTKNIFIGSKKFLEYC
jgi:hypothetical protein